MLKNTTEFYGSVSKFFHWIIALFVVIMLLVGLSFSFIDSKPAMSVLMKIHKSLGLTILLLMILRLIWRLFNVRPKLPSHLPYWQQRCAAWNHFLLYLTVILMTLSGWMMSTAGGHPTSFWWLFDINMPWVAKSKPLSHFAGDVHLWLAWIITALLVIHVLAAIQHHYIHKNNILKRILPCCKCK